MRFGNLNFVPVLENKDLVPMCVWNSIEKNISSDNGLKVLVAEINPEYMDGNKLCDFYNIDREKGFNCLIVECKRNEEKKYCSLMVPVGYKYNMSNIVRKYTNSRMVSVAPLDYVLNETGMEYGSITPIGLPDEWEILVDPMIENQDYIIIGSGFAKSKMVIPVDIFLKLPNVKIIENLAKTIEG